VIDLDLQLPLPRFTLSVNAKLDERVTAIVGRSGAGKTSLLESIAGLRAATGRIAIDGIDIALLPPEKRRIGYVPQDVALFPHLDVRGNIRFASRDQTRFASLVETLELAPLLGRAPATLSGGERQRVALARALMTEPRLLLLDEPLASVDQPLRERILLFLRRIRDLGIPMLYVTHQPFEALALATSCLVLDEGRVVAHGAPRDVLYDFASDVDNVFEVVNPRHDPTRGITRVTTTGGLELALPHDEVANATFPLVVRISGEEIVVFAERPTSISSRNVIEGTIENRRERDGSVDLTVTTPENVRVRVTRGAADDLQLIPGRTVWLAMRSRSFRIVG
jgi:molybdate transport system ATP-binding protein